MNRFDAIEQVFGTPDTWTVRPVTYAEVDPRDFMPEMPPLTPEEEAYNEYIEKEYQERGELAGTPRELECYECTGYLPNPPKMQKVVRLGAVVNPADPTQTYVLECGHVVI